MENYFLNVYLKKGQYISCSKPEGQTFFIIIAQTMIRALKPFLFNFLALMVTKSGLPILVSS